jgi:hypothetical protein
MQTIIYCSAEEARGDVGATDAEPVVLDAQCPHCGQRRLPTRPSRLLRQVSCRWVAAALPPLPLSSLLVVPIVCLDSTGHIYSCFCR